MRPLIIHDYLDNIGGGEKLMLSLARGIGADFATLDYNPKVVESMGFGDVKIIGFGTTPKIPPLKQMAASLKHWLADFAKDYDYFILSGNWAHYAAARHHPNIWYCHTPVRAFYTDYDRLAAGMSQPSRLLFKAWVYAQRRLDKRSVANVDKVIANSANTRARVRKYYQRDSAIVYPGIDTKKFKHIGTGDFWLSVNRIYPEKRVDLQVEAFRMMPDEKLVIVGGNLEGDHSGAYVRKVMGSAPRNVTFKGRVSEAELAELYGRCKGLVCTALDEDFGMTPVEAMASGKPVVATKEGGYLETVLDGKTGALVGADPKEIVAAIKAVGEEAENFRAACEMRARDFDLSVFVRRMREEIGILNAGF